MIDSNDNSIKKNSGTGKKLKIKSHNVNIGDVFCSLWGYEQTNVNFYEVMGVVGKCTVIVRELNHEILEEQSCFSGTVMPLKGSYYTTEVLRKRINNNDYPTININKAFNASLWDGEPMPYSNYG
tara:strand:+ start:160 stop:534 length:375 start_codon:yes stop_codon:yes gene_type:complete